MVAAGDLRQILSTTTRIILPYGLSLATEVDLGAMQVVRSVTSVENETVHDCSELYEEFLA